MIFNEGEELTQIDVAIKFGVGRHASCFDDAYALHVDGFPHISGTVLNGSHSLGELSLISGCGRLARARLFGGV